MKTTKKLTLSAMMVAIGAAFMAIGAFVQVLDLSAVALSSLLMVFVYIEIGHPYTWLVWLATAGVSFLISSGSTMWMVYLLVFGLYPIIKGYIEKLPRVFWLLLKLVYVNAMITLVYFGCLFILSVPMFGEVESIFGIPPIVIYILLWALLNVAFVAYDVFIVVMTRFYLDKLRPRFRKFLK
ncbi:MAG: hypothetical protein IJX38_00700 [Clostridia bacterium]|nr:hypothetical protein [Clostridia bacterium]